MTDMHDNSLDTYYSILETLPTSRAAVLVAIRKHQPVTRQTLGERLGWPINRITGRVRELIDCNAIHEKGTAYSESNKPRALLEINVPTETQQDLF